VPSPLDRLLGDRHVHYEEKWSSALGRDALVSELRRRFAAMGADLAVDGTNRFTTRTGSYWATAWTVNARWPMRWTLDVSSSEPPIVIVHVIDALPPGVRPGSRRLYLRAIRKAVDTLREGLEANPA
jgi:hypothetical protein